MTQQVWLAKNPSQSNPNNYPIVLPAAERTAFHVTENHQIPRFGTAPNLCLHACKRYHPSRRSLVPSCAPGNGNSNLPSGVRLTFRKARRCGRRNSWRPVAMRRSGPDRSLAGQFRQQSVRTRGVRTHPPPGGPQFGLGNGTAKKKGLCVWMTRGLKAGQQGRSAAR